MMLIIRCGKIGIALLLAKDIVIWQVIPHYDMLDLLQKSSYLAFIKMVENWLDILGNHNLGLISPEEVLGWDFQLE